MSLSILIPVYNFNVASLVHTLVSQLTATGYTGEIILWDDGSEQQYVSANQNLQDRLTVFYHRTEKNQGRMIARQQLAALAHFDYLLFLDCDSEIIKDDFLSVYYKAIKENRVLVSGGRVYTSEKPDACTYKLHWNYGTKRESDKRAAFLSNNFLVSRKAFMRIEMPVPLQGYGHEDTWWGIQWAKARIDCTKIYNPVLHNGLEKADDFIAKSENALANLLVMAREEGDKRVSHHVKIFRYYSLLKKLRLSGLYLSIESFFHNYLKRNLLSCNPVLLYFDCYRLALLIKKDRALGKQPVGK